ncbi:MFS transporter [Epibacterium ulvae]|uniref:MFS transporter n=1 Tax=Epibacterium ulvae TaxID=1156985 RepID=UPI001BFCA9CF|nr:MFS transporter [Epibacterium ulvae]MBT8152609.1 MFS transporter [Epibacterium ulvae]
MTHLWTFPNYRYLFSATAISNLGDGVSALAFPWLATLITRDPFLVAFVGFATRLPWLLLSIPAGVWTDRADRRQLMIRADLARLALTFGVIGIIFSVPDFPLADPLPYIFGLSALAFLLGCAEVLRDNAAQTVLPSVVPKDTLERANGQLWSIEQVMGSFVGPPLAGLLIAYAVPAPFVVDALTFGAAAMLVWAMRIPARPCPPKRSWRQDAREGFSWLWRNALILRLAIMLGLMNLLSMMTLAVLPLFVQDLWGLNAAQHGLLLTAGAAGGVAGGLLCPGIAARTGERAALLIALPAMACAMAMIAVAPSIWWVAIGLFVEMFAALLWNIVTVSYRQRHIPDALLGRVNSLYRFFGWGMIPFGALLGGGLVAHTTSHLGSEIALRLPYVAATLGMVAIWIYGIARLRL